MLFPPFFHKITEPLINSSAHYDCKNVSNQVCFTHFFQKKAETKKASCSFYVSL